MRMIFDNIESKKDAAENLRRYEGPKAHMTGKYMRRSKIKEETI